MIAQIGENLLSLALNGGIALAIFAYALRANRDDLRLIRRERRLVGISLISVFVLTPAVAIAVVEWIDMPVVVKLAIVALSFSIIAPTLPQKLGQDGRRPFANALMLLVALLSIVAIPVLVDLMGRLTEHDYGVAPGAIASYVGLVLGLPLVLGLIVRRISTDAARRLARPLTRVAFAVTSVAIAVAVAVNVPEMIKLIDVRTILGMVLFTLGALGVGHLMGGPRPYDAMVLARASATRHPAIALTIATANFPEHKFTPALMLCLIINAVISAAYVRHQRSRLERIVDEHAPGADATRINVDRDDPTAWEEEPGHHVG